MIFAWDISYSSRNSTVSSFHLKLLYLCSLLLVSFTKEVVNFELYFVYFTLTHIKFILGIPKEACLILPRPIHKLRRWKVKNVPIKHALLFCSFVYIYKFIFFHLITRFDLKKRHHPGTCCLWSIEQDEKFKTHWNCRK